MTKRKTAANIGLAISRLKCFYETFAQGSRWDENANNVENFEDIRKTQKHLKNSGLALTSEAYEKTKGPASLMLTDPDGNVILLDQHR